MATSVTLNSAGKKSKKSNAKKRSAWIFFYFLDKTFASKGYARNAITSPAAP